MQFVYRAQPLEILFRLKPEATCDSVQPRLVAVASDVSCGFRLQPEDSALSHARWSACANTSGGWAPDTP